MSGGKTEAQFLMDMRQAYLMLVDNIERRLQAMGVKLKWRTAEMREELKRLQEDQDGA